MRMELMNREPLNSIQWHMSQTWLPSFAMLSWHVKGESARESEVLSKLTAAQVAVNTTRGTTPGLLYPTVGEAGGRIALPLMGNGQVGPQPRIDAASAQTLVGTLSENNKPLLHTGPTSWAIPSGRTGLAVNDGGEYPDPTELSCRHISPYFQPRKSSSENPTTHSNIPGTAVPIPIDPWLQVRSQH